MKDTRIKELETVIGLSSVLLILFYVFEKPVLVIISLTLLLMSLIFKKFISRFISVWLKIVNFIGRILNKVVLFLVFFTVLTPIALVYRVFNRNALGIKKSDVKSYFFLRNHTYNQSDFEKNW